MQQLVSAVHGHNVILAADRVRRIIEVGGPGAQVAPHLNTVIEDARRPQCEAG